MNKPVALTQVEIMEALTLGSPLYTHPAELTDEEIIDIWNGLDMTSSPYADAITYARAILRKAQEK